MEQVEKKKMKAYKVFNPDWTCMGFKYEVGKSYHEEKVNMCSCGFHACRELTECFCYYDFNPENKVAEVELSGEIQKLTDNSKCCASDITIVRELTWHEVLDLCNSGSCNTGRANSGNCNSGGFNSGNCNSGNCNSGGFNSGDCNSRGFNSGDFNSGRSNSGHNNSGDSNSGCWNSGCWNSGCRNSGFFNTDEPTVRMFNKDTGLMVEQIRFPLFMFFFLNVWTSRDNATDKEKEEHKEEIEATGGFLKTLEYKEAWQIAWNHASKEEKEQTKRLPNFDADIFYEITGIRVN